MPKPGLLVCMELSFNNYPEAIEYALKAVRLGRRSGLPFLSCRQLGQFGCVLQQCGRPKHCPLYYKKAQRCKQAAWKQKRGKEP
jgi:hypothetical protein